MDPTDFEIVAALAFDGRMTFSDLATRVGLSGPSVAERVRRLESAGVIRGYAALLDPEALDAGLAAFVAVTLASPADRAGFLAAIAEEPAVLELHHVAGDDDFLLKVRCSSTRDLDRVVSESIKGIAGVARTRTTVVLSTAFERSVEPVRR